MQSFVSAQFSGAPDLQTLSAHLSSEVQASLSVQVTSFGKNTQPATGSQESFVQILLSSQIAADFDLQDIPSQASSNEQKCVYSCL